MVLDQELRDFLDADENTAIETLQSSNAVLYEGNKRLLSERERLGNDRVKLMRVVSTPRKRLNEGDVELQALKDKSLQNEQSIKAQETELQHFHRIKR